MNVAILSLGTRGDVEIFMALAGELAGRGHRVRMGVAGYHVDTVRRGGIEACAMHEQDRQGAVQVMRAIGAIADRVARTRAYYQGWLRHEIEAAKTRLPGLLGDADYFVSNLKLQLSRGGERVPGAFVDYDPPVDLAAFERLGTGTDTHRRRIIDLVALERDLVDPQRRWPAQYRFTGFWQPRRDGAAAPMGALRGFLEAGPPPVVVTLGSMAMQDPGALVSQLAAVTCRAGRRIVLVTGWAPCHEMAALVAGQEDRLHVVCEAPYAWLFSRAACVVHHGGTGTVAAVLAAGRPSVVVPQIACQQIFGEILMRDGAASAMVNLDGGDGDALAAAVDAAIADPRHGQRARHWAAQLAKGDGLARAVELIDEHARGVLGESPGGPVAPR
jgi:UDP:flavonoid glycosyltransferase YjiC (YdhE family)